MVIEDTSVLGLLCGAHDRNLRLLEELFQAKVLTRGNEILLETEDPGQRDQFARLVEQMKEQAYDGTAPDEGFIRGAYNLSGEKEEGTLRENSLEIPRGFRTVYPRTRTQGEYIRKMEERTLVFGLGPAGTGKTFLAVAQALRLVLSRRVRKIILTRPVVETGESLGFLPGDLAQKISPYLRPLRDAMEDLIPQEILVDLEERNMIEIAPLAYMRGRSLRNCCIILDEAQNTTREQMKMFLTRIGEESRAIITGDPSQIDLVPAKASGLAHAEALLKPIEEIGFTYFQSQDVMRNPLVKKIVEAYEKAH